MENGAKKLDINKYKLDVSDLAKQNYRQIIENKYSSSNPNNQEVQNSSNAGSLMSLTTISMSSSDNSYQLSQNCEKELVQENWIYTIFQVGVPFMIAGIGTIDAGVILSLVQQWEVFDDVSELLILVPALLGLKGNLDMCLASRLSTQYNLGNMKRRRDILNMIIGNVALVQVQAIVASLVVAVFAISVGSLMHGEFKNEHALMLCTSSVITATTSCFALDFVLIGVILLSRQLHLNPDNVATPLAASIGVVSISVLSAISAWLFQYHDSDRWLLGLALSIYIILLIVWILIVLRNKYTRPVLFSGWVPVISALIISGLGGLVLDSAVEHFDGFVLFQPIINGIGGNLVSVQASRISTLLHKTSVLGILPANSIICESPWRAILKGVPYAKMARILIMISMFGQTIFIFVADFIQSSTVTLDIFFVLIYLVVSTLQLIILLYIAHVIIHVM